MPNEHRADPTPPPHHGQGRGGSKKESSSIKNVKSGAIPGLFSCRTILLHCSPFLFLVKIRLIFFENIVCFWSFVQLCGPKTLLVGVVWCGVVSCRGPTINRKGRKEGVSFLKLWPTPKLGRFFNFR